MALVAAARKSANKNAKTPATPHCLHKSMWPELGASGKGTVGWQGGRADREQQHSDAPDTASILIGMARYGSMHKGTCIWEHMHT